MRQNLRSLLFWGLDRFRGRRIRHHYEDVKWHLQHSVYADLKKAQNNKISNILQHAISTVPFYQNLNLQEGIESFPVIDKQIIKNKFQEFRSNKFLDEKRLTPVITSGSTGTPFKIFHNKNKRFRNTADTIYFGDLAGYSLGEKLFYLKIWSENNKKDILNQKMQNIYPVDVLNLSDNTQKVLREIQHLSAPLHLLSYVSALEALIKTLQEHPELKPPRGKMNSVITMSEYLPPQTKLAGEEIFKCPVLSRYSNIENGIIAQQTLEEQQYFTVNSGSYFLEILDLEKDMPVPYGETGRIVVTDFFNLAMPMIRYDTGDLGTLEEKWIAGIKKVCLTKVEGRKLDQLFNTEGKLISSYIVYKNMWKYHEIDQYQLIQKAVKSYVFKITASDNFTREKELKAEFLRYLGEDANFAVEYVKEIPLLNSGKRRKVVNLMERNAT